MALATTLLVSDHLEGMEMICLSLSICLLHHSVSLHDNHTGRLQLQELKEMLTKEEFLVEMP